MGGQMPALGYGANTAITNVVNTSGWNFYLAKMYVLALGHIGQNVVASSFGGFLYTEDWRVIVASFFIFI